VFYNPCNKIAGVPVLFIEEDLRGHSGTGSIAFSFRWFIRHISDLPKEIF
jgi:hypothetical protein